MIRGCLAKALVAVSDWPGEGTSSLAKALLAVSDLPGEGTSSLAKALVAWQRRLVGLAKALVAVSS